MEKKLAEMGLEVPITTTPLANYVSSMRTGNLMFVAGHLPGLPDGSLLNPGKLGHEVTIEQGYESAQRAMLNCLASVRAGIGDLDKVKRVIKVLCMVNSGPEFGDQPAVANGASDFLVSLYGDRGSHARSAVGVARLPGGSCVEIEMIVEVED